MGNDYEEVDRKSITLHLRIKGGDVTANAELAEFLLPILTVILRRKFVQIYDPDLVDTAVTDALIGYFLNPEQYQPEKQSLRVYLLMSAKGDFLNMLKAKKVDKKSVDLIEDVEFGDTFAEDSIEGTVAVDDFNVEDEVTQRLSPVWTEIKKVLPDAIDQEILKMMMDGIRETTEYANILGVGYLDDDSQRDIVKRHKDRIKKVVSRKIDPKELRDNV